MTHTGSNTTGPFPFPDGTLLLHIGPHKTGTTSLQGAFHNARPLLNEQGVHYAGRKRHSLSAIHAVTVRGAAQLPDGSAAIDLWSALVKDSYRQPARQVVLSSEGFAHATHDQIQRIVGDLGIERVRVVVTLRPLAKIAPSQWQQYVQDGVRASYPDWLESVFAEPPGASTPSFWLRHRHDALVDRWASVVGLDRLTVVAVDDQDHRMLLDTFEGLTGLAAGTLFSERDYSNRSLTFAETEAIRAMNVEFAAQKRPRASQRNLVYLGAATYLKEVAPRPDELRIQLPRWAARRVHQISSEMVANLKSSGVRIIGDVDRMVAPVGNSPETVPATVDVSPGLAARMAMGAVLAAEGEGEKAVREVERRLTAPPPPRLRARLARRLRAKG